MAPYGTLWHPMAPYGTLWHPMAPYGTPMAPLCPPMRPYDTLWHPMTWRATAARPWEKELITLTVGGADFTVERHRKLCHAFADFHGMA